MKKTFLAFSFVIVASFAAYGQQQVQQSAQKTIDFWVYDATTGAPKTGVTVTTFTCSTVKNDMTYATFSAVACGTTHCVAELGNGGYSLYLPTTDLNLAGTFTATCSVTGAVSAPVRLQVVGAPAYTANTTGSIASLQDLMDFPTANMTTASSFGNLIRGNVDIPISSVSTGVWGFTIPSPGTVPPISAADSLNYLIYSTRGGAP